MNYHQLINAFKHPLPGEDFRSVLITADETLTIIAPQYEIARGGAIFSGDIGSRVRIDDGREGFIVRACGTERGAVVLLDPEHAHAR